MNNRVILSSKFCYIQKDQFVDLFYETNNDPLCSFELLTYDALFDYKDLFDIIAVAIDADPSTDIEQISNAEGYLIKRINKKGP